MELPHVSIIIPTHNRGLIVDHMLDVLSAQSYPLSRIEVVVAADGCTDSTVELITGHSLPYAFRYCVQPQLGAGAARNHGASLASGEILVFLDDDVDPAPGCIEAHVRAHQEQPGRVVIGFLQPVLDRQEGFFRDELTHWWEAMFEPLHHPGHRFRYQDLLSGNFSVSAGLFHQVGGFDPRFRCHEDYELGLRLLHAGGTFVFVPEARADHHDASTLERALQRKYDEGVADVMLGYRHPALRPWLPMRDLRSSPAIGDQTLRLLAFERPALAERIAARLRSALDLAESVRLRTLWRRILYGLLGYWYWKGVRERLPTRARVTEFLAGGGPSRVNRDDMRVMADIDLRHGLELAEEKLDRERPAGARIRFGKRLVGYELPAPGLERLRGSHLRPMLEGRLAASLLRALALEGALGASPATPTTARSNPGRRVYDDIFGNKWYCETFRGRSWLALLGAAAASLRYHLSGR